MNTKVLITPLLPYLPLCPCLFENLLAHSCSVFLSISRQLEKSFFTFASISLSYFFSQLFSCRERYHLWLTRETLYYTPSNCNSDSSRFAKAIKFHCPFYFRLANTFECSAFPKITWLLTQIIDFVLKYNLAYITMDANAFYLSPHDTYEWVCKKGRRIAFTLGFLCLLKQWQHIVQLVPLTFADMYSKKVTNKR